MAIGQIPPWLNVGPTDYLHAIQAGTQAGLEVSRQRAAMQEAEARRALAQQEAQQRIWEFGETMRQRAAQQALEQELEREKMAQTGRYQSGLLDWHNQQAQLAAEKAQQQQAYQNEMLGLRGENLNLSQARLDETMRRNQELEALRREAAASKVSPTDYETVTERTPAVPGQPGIPEVPAEKQSFLGIDWLWPDKPAVPAVAPVPGIPSRSVTRRIPLNAIAPQEGTVPETDEMTDEEYAAQFGNPSGQSRTKSERIRVKSPDGKTGTVSSENLQEALDAGYTRL